MRIFVTAGNTQVSIDRVRCITNIFTGRTGAAIALEAYRRGHQVTLVTSHPETIEVAQRDEQRWQCCGYRSFEDLEGLMDHHIARLMQDAVVHCAAVSDYRAAGIFAPSPGTRFHADDLTWQDDQKTPALIDRSAGKVKSDESELWLRLVRAPKLVDKIRKEWNYRGLLVKFKLEVGLSDGDLLAIAEKSRRQSNADWMVANTLEGAADWAFLGDARGYKQVTRAGLAGALLDVLEQQHQESQRG
jgi:phosphopantothenoylcysteine synthetase/decarboxylase